ncbi:MAG: hypothetical protein GXZ01_05150 [Clostridiaceae bacterium]|jgi:hypothetical protein|nr:hypothetical protein [Clostridiaceae bacterium]
MARKKYKNLFKVETVEYDNRIRQEIVYTGDYYITDMPGNLERRYKICLLLIPVIMAVLFIGAGFLDNDGSRAFYVVMPYVIQFLPISFMIISAVSFYPKSKLTVVQYEKTFKRIGIAGIWVLILSFASVLGEVVFLLAGHGNTPEQELVFLVCSIITAVSAVAALRIHGKIRFRTEPNEKNG